MTAARRLALAALSLGGAAAFAGSPYMGSRGRIDVVELSSTIARDGDHITATELAQWIRDRKTGLRVIDIRPAGAFEAYHIPTAENVPIDGLGRLHVAAGDTLVLYSDDGARAAQAWMLLRASGIKDVYSLRAGLGGWLDDVMSPAHSTDLTRYFGGVARSRDAAGEAADGRQDSAARAARLIRRGC